MTISSHLFHCKQAMKNPTLLLIDIQNDYFPGGKMELSEMNEATENAKSLLSTFRKNKWPVIFIQHLANKEGASFFIPETSGAEIHASIHPHENETVITKNYPNSFRNTSLHQHLQMTNCTKLVICGAMSHMCIDTTTRAANDLGYSCTLISDACATRDLSFESKTISASNVHGAFMAALNGTFARVISIREFIHEISEN